MGNRRFLGQFGNDTVSLTLKGLPPHQAATISLELFILNSWDGNAPDASIAPDIWDLSVGDGPTLLRTTFSHLDHFEQAFPDFYPGGNYPARTGADEVNSLGYSADSVYWLVFTFPHDAETLRLDFSGHGLQQLWDESWGLDNVQVTLIPPDDTPRVRTSLQAGGVWTPTSGAAVTGVSVSGIRALVLLGDSRVQLLDLSRPEQPVALGVDQALLEIADAVLVGDLAYVASWEADFLSTVEIFDFSDPAAPVLRGYYDTPGYAHSLAVVGTTIYIADGESGLLILDARDPTAPLKLGSYATQGPVERVQISGSRAYLASGRWLMILDVADPTKPRRVGLYEAGGVIGSLSVVDQTAYLVLNTGRLEILDVSVPTAVSVLGSMRTWGRIEVSDGYAYLAKATRGVEILDVNNEAAPVWVTGLSGFGPALDLAVSGRQILVATGASGLQVLELRQQLQPPLNPPVVADGTVTLSWPAMDGVYLQHTTTLAPANWLTVSGTEGTNTVTVPISGARGFFRLAQDP